ncbi:MAG TPA: mercuric reductase [Acidisarcina sp.]
MTFESRRYDAIVLGSGQAGNPLAAALAAAGKTVAVIESTHVGGTCINDGCTPTKTMVASARVAYLARRGVDFGVRTGPIGLDLGRVRERKRAMVQKSRGSNQKRLETTAGIDLIFGAGSFVDPHTVRVAPNDLSSERDLTSELIFINTGLRNQPPDVQGLSGVPCLDNVSIMELDEVPDHLLVLGGGYVGVEFSQMFRRFGSRVTIVQKSQQLLTREDQDIAEEVRKILIEDGIEVLLSASVEQVSQRADGQIQMNVRQDSGPCTLTGSHLLLAAGRTPNTGRLNLKAAGIDADEHGAIKVDDRLETTAPGIYALGDVKGGPAFTHISYDDFRIVRGNLLEGKQLSKAGRMLPYTVFIDPELGRIGLTEAEARKQGLKIKVAKMPMSSVARALEMDESRGVMKMIVDADTELILGAAILGVYGGETASLIQIAMMGKLPYTALRDGIFSHPTLAESLNNLLQKFV